MKIEELKTILENRVNESKRMLSHYFNIGDIEMCDKMRIEIDDTEIAIKKLEE